LLWIGLILYLTIFSGSSLNSFQFFNHADKLVHFGLFLVFSYLLMLDLLNNNPSSGLRGVLTLVVIITLFTGMSTEIIQHMFVPGRTGSIFDFMVDTAGSVSGMLAYRLVILR